jgi:hypothetical protein
MSLKNWLNNGWLTEHRTSAQEIILSICRPTRTDPEGCIAIKMIESNKRKMKGKKLKT